jgi:hypothetical protein
MARMANRAYASIWCRDSSPASLLERFERLLGTVFSSEAIPGFSYLTIRAVSPEEAPLTEHDLRAVPLDAAGVVEIAREFWQADCACEVQAHWDLWVYETATGRWLLRPQPLEILCWGEDYDAGEFASAGHFQADVGFEHLFTGHARLLASRGQACAPPEHPAEADFLRRMEQPEMLRDYREKTSDNIHRLLDWIQRAEAALPVARYRLWSEGEENFEARLDEILALR